MQYGLIAGLIAVAAITATFLVGKETNAVFFDIDSALMGSGGGSGPFGSFEDAWADGVSRHDGQYGTPADGVFDATEWAAMGTDGPMPDFTATDSDGDGYIDKVEGEQAWNNMPPPGGGTPPPP